MRSLIIIEVEHGESTDGLDSLIHRAKDPVMAAIYGYEITNYTVRVDLPSCFELEN